MRNQNNNTDNHAAELEEAYALMMDALDGNLNSTQSKQFRIYLRKFPELNAEWRSMQVIDSWLTDAPTAKPSAAFTEQTVLRLPDISLRRWAVALAFALVLLLGTVPLMGLAILFANFSIADPLTSFQAISQMAGVIGNAIFQVLTNWGTALTQNPASIGIFLVMTGAVTLWSGIYNRLTTRTVVIARS